MKKAKEFYKDLAPARPGDDFPFPCRICLLLQRPAALLACALAGSGIANRRFIEG